MLKNHDLRENVRHLAGVLFKNTVLNKTRDERFDGLWLKLSEDEKDQLKQSLLEALGSDELGVIRAAASCISAVCTFEFPRERWLNVIDLLCSNINHELNNIRQASLLALGYICEEFARDELGSDVSGYILTAFLDALENNVHDTKIMVEAIKGLYSAIKFSVEHFKNKQGDLIIDRIVETLKHNDEEVRQISMQCFVEIARLCYDYLIDEYIGKIMDATLDRARCDADNVSSQAIEVWSSIGDEEVLKQQRNQSHLNIIRKSKKALLEMIFEVSLKVNMHEEDNEQEWGPAVSAGCCLSIMTQVLGNDIVDEVTLYVGEHITSDNWEERY